MRLDYTTIAEIARLHKYFGRTKKRGDLESIDTGGLPKGVYRCTVLEGTTMKYLNVNVRAHLRRVVVMPIEKAVA